MPHRWKLVAVCAPILFVTWVLSGFSETGALWAGLRVCLALVACTAVLTWRRWPAVVAVVAWALVAAPVGVGAGELRSYGALGDELGAALPSGPHAMRAGSVPTGPVWVTSRDKGYINGEGGYPDADLVVWSFVALPWPHFDRVKLGELGGTSDNWTADEVSVWRHGNELFVAGSALQPASEDPEGLEVEADESIGLVWALSTASVVWVGWFAIAVCWWTRRVRARASARA